MDKNGLMNSKQNNIKTQHIIISLVKLLKPF